MYMSCTTCTHVCMYVHDMYMWYRYPRLLCLFSVPLTPTCYMYLCTPGTVPVCTCAPEFVFFFFVRPMCTRYRYRYLGTSKECFIICFITLMQQHQQQLRWHRQTHERDGYQHQTMILVRRQPNRLAFQSNLLRRTRRL